MNTYLHPITAQVVIHCFSCQKDDILLVDLLIIGHIVKQHFLCYEESIWWAWWM